MSIRSVVVAADDFVGHAFDFVFDLVICFAHETFDRVNRTFRVRNSLTFCRVAYFALATVDKCDDRRRCVAAFAIGDNYRVVAFKNGNARVGCT